MISSFIKYLTVFSLLLFILSSCSQTDECSLFDPVEPLISLKFIDESSNKIIGEGNVYHPDTIVVLNEWVYFEVEEENSIIKIYYAGESSNSDIYLKLSNSEIDTLRVTYNYVDVTTAQGCNYTDATIENVIYNNIEVISSDDEVYTIIK